MDQLTQALGGPLTGMAEAVSVPLLVAAAAFTAWALARLLVSTLPSPQIAAVQPPDTELRPEDSSGRVAPGQVESTERFEVDYLERMLAAGAPAERVSFTVAEVVAGAARTGRALGLKVSVFSRDETVQGVPDDLAAVLDTLVADVSRNADARDVHLRSARSGEFVEVLVGPVSRERTDRGLGLHISRNLLREQGGDLVLRDTAHGTSFVARIPARIPQQRQAPHDRA